MIAAWQVRPPRLVTIADARFITGSQFGIGHVGDQHVAGLHRGHLGGVLDDAHRADADLVADGAAGREHLASCALRR